MAQSFLRNFWTTTIPLLVIGVLLSGYGLTQLWLAEQARWWPTTQGRLLSCELNDPENPTACFVTYEYEQNGTWFQGDRIAYGYAGSPASGTHRAIFDRLNEAESVLVYVRPSNPQESTLSVGMNSFGYFIFLFGCAFWLPVVIYSSHRWVGKLPWGGKSISDQLIFLEDDK